MKASLSAFLLITITLSTPQPASGQAYTLRDLLIKVPEEVNSLLVIHVPSLHRSTLGRQEQWSKKHEAAFQAGKVPFPPQTIFLVIAGHTNVNLQGVQHSGDLALISLSQSLPFDRLVEYEQGIVEEVASQKVVLTPRNVYIAPLSARLVGVQKPADRQALSRWLQFTKRNQTPVLSEWLRETAMEIDTAGQVIMALHLEDAVDVRRIRQRLGEAQPPLPQGTDLDALAAALASVRGLRFAVKVETEIQAEMRIEFNRPIKTYESLLQPILARGVENLGEGIPSLKEWKMEVAENVVTFRSPLTKSAFAELLSSLGAQAAPASVAVKDEAPGGDKAFASRRYLQQVTTLLDELGNLMPRMTDYNVAARTNEEYAQKIDRLPVYGADEDLVKYATGVTGKLRTIAESLRGVPITAAVLEASRKETFYYQPPRFVNTGGYGWHRRFRPGLWGGVGTYIPQQAYYDSNLPELRGKLAEAIAQDQQNREKIWKTIETDTKRIREKLAAKYGGGFK